MSDITIMKGDNRVWTIGLSDADGAALDLTSASVSFRLKWAERFSQTYFVRDTAGTGSDYIAINAPASDGIVAITPTTSDWADISDSYGVYVGNFVIVDSSSITQYAKDFTVNVQEPV